MKSDSLVIYISPEGKLTNIKILLLINWEGFNEDTSEASAEGLDELVELVNWWKFDFKLLDELASKLDATKHPDLELEINIHPSHWSISDEEAHKPTLDRLILYIEEKMPLSCEKWHLRVGSIIGPDSYSWLFE